jgi:hypothetical protein
LVDLQSSTGSDVNGAKVTGIHVIGAKWLVIDGYLYFAERNGTEQE